MCTHTHTYIFHAHIHFSSGPPMLTSLWAATEWIVFPQREVWALPLDRGLLFSFALSLQMHSHPHNILFCLTSNDGALEWLSPRRHRHQKWGAVGGGVVHPDPLSISARSDVRLTREVITPETSVRTRFAHKAGASVRRQRREQEIIKSLHVRPGWKGHREEHQDAASPVCFPW